MCLGGRSCKILISLLRWNVALLDVVFFLVLDIVFLVSSYSLSELKLYYSILSWLLGFVLRSLR
jgi:hypothetical protein